jgi:hypothetical protein
MELNVAERGTIAMRRIVNLSSFKFVRLIFVVAIFLFMIGCATPGRSGYVTERPNSRTFKNEKIVNRPFNQVWDDLVRDLAKSFFVINNIDKESRIINVSFNSETPEKFIDCGKTRRTYSRGKENEEYAYEIAASSFYKTAFAAGPNKNLPGTNLINRRTSLDGRMNIYVAPKEGGTQISVNARYIFTVNVSGSYVIENVYGKPIANGNLPPHAAATCSFNTNQPNTCVWGAGQETVPVTCQSKGVLENEILNFVK